MGKILNCIIIDQFTCKRLGSIYLLTHWHADHYMGISSNWPYGAIYCSPITRKLLLSKFPKLKETVKALDYGTENEIEGEVITFQGEERILKMSVRIYDSNHMAGSIMILIQLEGKNYFHTGDMRFGLDILKNESSLFRSVVSERGQPRYVCNYQIEKLFLDNTFCDPLFMFPPRSFALKLITNIVTDYRPTRLFICTDSVGKEEAFIYLSERYESKVKVSKDRMSYIRCMFSREKCEKHFTLREEGGCWIESIRKGEKEARVAQCKGSIAVTLTGWANLNDYYPTGYNCFIVPYSLHSNFKEIQMCVKTINPKHIVPIVEHRNDKTGKQTKFKHKIGSFEGYMFSLMFLKQRGLRYLRKKYCLQDGGDEDEGQRGSKFEDYQEAREKMNFKAKNESLESCYQNDASD